MSQSRRMILIQIHENSTSVGYCIACISLSDEASEPPDIIIRKVHRILLWSRHSDTSISKFISYSKYINELMIYQSVNMSIHQFDFFLQNHSS